MTRCDIRTHGECGSECRVSCRSIHLGTFTKTAPTVQPTVKDMAVVAIFIAAATAITAFATIPSAIERVNLANQETIRHD